MSFLSARLATAAAAGQPAATTGAATLPEPVLHLKLDETSGTTAVDAKGLQNGTYTAPELGIDPLVPGASAKCVGFNGSTSRVAIPDVPGLELAAYTVAFAFQLDAGPAVGANKVFFSKDAVPGATSIEAFNDGGTLRIRAYAGSSTGALWLTPTTGSTAAAIAVGAPYILALALDGSGARLYLIDAADSLTELANVPGATAGWVGNTSAISFGAYQGNDAFIDGLLDDLRIWDRALTPDEVALIAPPQQVVWLADWAQTIQASTSMSLGAPSTHPVSGYTTSVIADGATVDLTASGSIWNYVSGAAGSDSAQVRISYAGTPSRTATISFTIQPAEVVADFMVPRTDVWLTNDDQDPATLGATQRFSAPGAPTGGSGLSAGSPRDLATLLSVASAGHVIRLAQGYYSMPNGLTIPAGASASNPVTVVAEQGAWAVICKDIDCLKVPNIDAGAGRTEVLWTLWDAAHNIWRIPYTAAQASEGVIGCWFEGGIAHLLLPYDQVAHMMASQGGDAGNTRDSVSTPQTRFVYWGPGVAVGDASGGTGTTTHLYIRFDRPNWTDIGFQHSTYAGWPDDDRWTLGVEGQTVPRKWFRRANTADFRTGRPVLPNPLNLTPDASGNFSGVTNPGTGLPYTNAEARNPNNARIYVARTLDRAVINASSGSFIRIGSGVNTHGFKTFLHGKSNVEVHRGCDWLPFRGISGGATNVTFHRRRQWQGWWRMLTSMAAYKFGIYLSPQYQNFEYSANTHSTFCRNGATDHFTNITWENCLIAGYHEIFEGNTGTLSQIRVVQSCIFGGYDEFVQTNPSKLSRWEVGYCYFRDSAYGIGSVENETGTQNPYSSVYMHHNIIDNRCPRGSFDSPREINGGAAVVGRANSASFAAKNYNNTWIQAPDDSGSFGGQGDPGAQMSKRPSGAGSAVTYSEEFNNIYVKHDTKRYYSHEGGEPRHQHDAVSFGLLTGAGHTGYRDYNCYSRHGLPVLSSGSYLQNKVQETNYHTGTPKLSYAYMRAQPAGEPSGSVWYGTTGNWSLTPTRPSGGRWEDNGTDINPQIPSCSSFPASRLDYRPRASHAGTGIASSLSGANWWSSPGWTSYGTVAVPFNMAPSAWKGALDPSGATMPVGVQNP